MDTRPRDRGGSPRHATSACALVPRPRARVHTPPHARRRSFQLDARPLRMESPCCSPMRGFNGTRTALSSPELSVRAGASGHGVCFAIHLLFAAFALFTGHRRGALWIMLPGVIVHFYPLLLQRSIMLRLQPLLDKSGSWVHKGTRCTAIAEQAAAGDARNART